MFDFPTNHAVNYIINYVFGKCFLMCYFIRVSPQPIQLHIEGMHCASCVAKIEKALAKVPGVAKASVNLGLEEAIVVAGDGGVDEERLLMAVAALGYKASPVEERKQLSEDPYQKEFRHWLHRFLLALPAAGALMVLMAQKMRGLAVPLWVEGALAAIVYFVAGLPFLRGMISSLARRSPDMNALIGIGATAAFFSGYFETAATLLTFLIAGRLLEAKVKRAASASLHSLFHALPRAAHRRVAGELEEVAVEALHIGDEIVIKPGEQIPADGEIISGISGVDESLVTGEALPVVRRKGDAVFAGTHNQEGSLTLRIQKTGTQTYLAQIALLTEQALMNKSTVEKLADKISGVFVPIVLILAAATFAGWVFIGRLPAMEALPFAIAVLIIACPCALGLATPTAVIAGVGQGARHGILIKGGEVLEKIKNLHTILFDKTGTLTEGKPAVKEILVSKKEAAEADEVLKLAAAVENFSEHLLGQAIVKAAKEKGFKSADISSFKNYPGLGAMAVWEEKEICVGSGAFMNQNGISTEELAEAAERKRVLGRTVIFVAQEKQLMGAIVLEDVLKPGGAEAVAALQSMGLRVWMLTGDQKATADEVAQRLGIQKVFSALQPHEKTAVITELKKEGLGIAMVGDGINDAPALAAADVGIAMARGSDIAKQAGDITLVGSDPLSVVTAIRLAQRTHKTIRENLWLSFSYNLLAIPIAAGILYSAFGLKLSPEIAAIAMSLSSISVVANSLRLKMAHNFKGHP